MWKWHALRYLLIMTSFVTPFHPLADTDGATFLAGIIYHKSARTFYQNFFIASEHGDGLLRL